MVCDTCDEKLNKGSEYIDQVSKVVLTCYLIMPAAHHRDLTHIYSSIYALELIANIEGIALFTCHFNEGNTVRDRLNFFLTRQ